MISNSSSTNSLNSNTTRITIPRQDHRKRYAASYARGVALCLPLTRPASAPLARSRAVEARPARGEEENNLLCAVRQSPARSRSAIAARTPRSTASYPRDAARAGTIAPAQGLPQDRGETHLLCGVRPAAASRLRRTARYAASYCSRSRRPLLRRPAPLARYCIFSFLSRKMNL